MNLKPQDILVLLKIAVDSRLSYSAMAYQLAMSPSEVHAAVKRAAGAGLLNILNPTTRELNRDALRRFLVHGVRRAFPAKPGPLTRGMPTAHAALPLSTIIVTSKEDLPPVWSHPDGDVRGCELPPIYKSAPTAAKLDPKLYEYLALVDALRSGRAREREAAKIELNRLLGENQPSPIPAGPFAITEDDLDRWSNSNVNSAAVLPDLIRQIVHFLVPPEKVEHISFPAYSAANRPGFDGELVTRGESRFAGTEASVWELSTESNVSRKINAQYSTRTSNSLGCNKRTTTYIALTNHIWRNKERWVREKKAEDNWVDVRVYDATDIAQWLALAPVPSVWFSSLIGKSIEDTETVEEYFGRWSGRTGPSLTESVVLAGREGEVKRLREWLNHAPSRLVIHADTLEECCVFLCAGILSGDKRNRENWLTRTVIIKSEKAWNRWLKRIMGQNQSPLILVPAFSGFDGSTYGLEGHYLLISTEKGHARGRDASVLELRPINRDGLADALFPLLRPPADGRSSFEPGEKSRDPKQLAYECGGKLTVLQRRLGYEPPDPAWTQEKNAELLCAILLAGEWTPRNQADQVILAKLAGGVDYAQFERLANELAEVPDPPLRRQGQTIKWRSIADAWQRLSRKLTRSVLDHFREACINVLSRSSPRYALPVEERVFAALHGAELPESSEIRRGLTDSLAWMSVVPEERWTLMRPSEVRELVGDVIRRVLQEDWKTWATLKSQLPSLAEASPATFLNAVDKAIDDRRLNELFRQDRPDDAFAECCHAGLLWALEGLAWHPDHFSHVVPILAKLSGIETEGKHSNRASASLASLFHPAVKQSACSNDERLAVLKSLTQKEENVGWLVVCHILEVSVRGSCGTSNHRPVFNKWDVPDPLENYSPREISEYLKAVQELAVDMLSRDIRRLDELLKHGALDAMPGEVLTFLKEHIDAVREQRPEFIVAVGHSVREWISLQSRSKGKTDRSADLIERATELVEELSRDNLATRSAWLFSYQVMLSDEGKYESDWRKREEHLRELRSAALRDIIQRGRGFQDILALADAAEEPFLVGATLAGMDEGEQWERDVVEGPLLADGKRKSFALEFVARRHGSNGLEWLTGLVRRLTETGHLPIAVDVLKRVCSTPELRDWVDAQGGEIRQGYWENVALRYVSIRDDADFSRIVDRVLAAHRWEAALELADGTLSEKPVRGRSADYLRILTHPFQGATNEEIARGLQNHSMSWSIPRILRLLDTRDDVNPQDLIPLEVAYLSLLEHSERPPKHIMRELEENPKFFADLIAMVFRPASQKEPETSVAPPQETVNKVQNAQRILAAWKGYPGRSLPPAERDRVLREWCDMALKLTKEADRELVGQHQVGEVLARVPPPEDGVWPCRVARQYLEDGFREIGRGMEIARFNSRGVVSKSLTEGGAQERKLAYDLQNGADKIKTSWPRTAALLDDMARYYLHQAELEDGRAEEFSDP